MGTSAKVRRKEEREKKMKDKPEGELICGIVIEGAFTFSAFVVLWHWVMGSQIRHTRGGRPME